MSRILENIKRNFKNRDLLTKLIYINIGGFLIMQTILAFLILFNKQDVFQSIIKFIQIPADASLIIEKPWTIISYMFFHQNFWHLLVNMICLYWGGKIFLAFFDNKKMISTYLLGGISGGLCFILAFNTFPVFQSILPHAILIGSSASVLSIIMAIATKSPNYIIRLPLMGKIKLKYLSVFMITLSLFSVSESQEEIDKSINLLGTFFAHLGGAFFGFLYVKQLNGGNDIASGFNKIMEYLLELLKRKPKLKKVYSRSKSDDDFRKEKIKEQAKIDKILDKIAKSGYDGLTKEEKEILFKASKK